MMNTDLVERFHRSRRTTQEMAEDRVCSARPARVNLKIREYFETTEKSNKNGWLSRSEIPSALEVLDTNVDGSSSSEVVEIPVNRIDGPWDSKEDYLSSLYELLREDAVQPLREAIWAVRSAPSAPEDAFAGKIGIYENVHICGITLSTRGIAVRVTFSIARAGKNILWEQSKRLTSGVIVVLTPATDMFRSRAIVATVAARPLPGLQKNPPELDLFFARSEELEIDPAVEYVIIEERSSFFEAERHNLCALQHMAYEPFPLSEHLIDVQATVPPPLYVQEKPHYDLSAISPIHEQAAYQDIDIINNWPGQLQSNLDTSQLAALRRVLAKQLAIVQGPPGTGKTHVSVQAIKVMLANRRDSDPPIIIACQTNHAIDQMLRHVAAFEPNFVRLGGMTKDLEIVKPRTLYEIRKTTTGQKLQLQGSVFNGVNRDMKVVERQFETLLTPLQDNKQALDHRLLQKLGIITDHQADSLEAGASRWISKQRHDGETSPMMIWMGDKLIAVSPVRVADRFGFDYEEADLEFEQLKEIEAESLSKDDDEFEILRGPYHPVADNYTCRKPSGLQPKLHDILKQQDLWKIPEAHRGYVYLYLQTELKKLILMDVRQQAKAFDKLAMRRRIGRWEQDELILREQSIIGMTTTGLSKYRPLVSSLSPKIIIIEEAAETLEPPVTVACMPSVQHLILVGDHKQLRPQTRVSGHSDIPFNLNISLFERMLRNKVEFNMLTKQRRMIPEIRRLLFPIYGNQIQDHPSVSDVRNRPDVPGMGGLNSFFFTHRWPEQRDDLMSCYNPLESKMIVGFVEYLFDNGMETKDITILTFYNGQRKRILGELRSRPSLRTQRFKVVTVDSYQGEENQVVLLSLVRSNNKNQIGFLSVDNRACVALSRAQRGFYLFGNGDLLYGLDSIWKTVIEIMAGSYKGVKPKVKPPRLGTRLPLHCTNHDNQTYISDPEDWNNTSGGCKLKCSGILHCGHPCNEKCHPFTHDTIACQQCAEDGTSILPSPADSVMRAENQEPSSPTLVRPQPIAQPRVGRTPKAPAKQSSKSSASTVAKQHHQSMLISPLIDFGVDEEPKIAQQMELISLEEAQPSKETTIPLVDELPQQGALHKPKAGFNETHQWASDKDYFNGGSLLD